MKNIIICGGSGTRLWPVSRTEMPKQFCDLGFDNSLFQMTILRNENIVNETIIVTNKSQKFLATNQIDNLNKKNYRLMLEPVGRNTAPAIALACLMLSEDDIVLVSAADHIIGDVKEYERISLKAKEYAEQGYIVTYGISAKSPNTGYGYIEADGEDVISFREKPDKETATKYLEAGNYYWNSGMFVFKVSTLFNEMEKFCPEILEKCRQALNHNNEKEILIDMENMLSIPSDSIDYAVMEKSDKIKVFPSDIAWSDVGSYDSLFESLEKDEDKNVKIGPIVEKNSKNNLILGNDRLVVAVDVEDLIITDTKDALFVSKKGSSDKVKQIINEIETVKPQITKAHITTQKPWGSYTILEQGDRFKVKTLDVKPGEKLSVQKHFHRSEHWTVVNGTAEVTIGDKKSIVRSNESVYIPIGSIHTLSNPGKMMLTVIETQVGDYLGEDDIVRYEDNYGRKITCI